MYRNLLFILAIFCLVGVVEAEPTGDKEVQKSDTFIEDGFDEQEMEKAIAKARATTDQFIKVLGEKKGENFAVKAHIEDEKNGEGEHIWLTDVSFKDGKFIGRINNEPAVVGNVKMGQQWTVAKDEISDWLYMNKGKMYGNYTLRPLLKAMPEAQAKQLRAILADP